MKNPWPISMEQQATVFARHRLAGKSIEESRNEVIGTLGQEVYEKINRLLPQRQASWDTVKIGYDYPARITVTGTYIYSRASQTHDIRKNIGVKRVHLQNRTFFPDPEKGFDWLSIAEHFHKERWKYDPKYRNRYPHPLRPEKGGEAAAGLGDRPETVTEIQSQSDQ